jgi:hypothetical protein
MTIEKTRKLVESGAISPMSHERAAAERDMKIRDYKAAHATALRNGWEQEAHQIDRLIRLLEWRRDNPREEEGYPFGYLRPDVREN